VTAASSRSDRRESRTLAGAQYGWGTAARHVPPPLRASRMCAPARGTYRPTRRSVNAWVMIPPSRARRPSFDAAAAMLRAGLARAPADERAVRRCSARRPDARAARPAPASDRAPDAVAGPRSRAEAARPCEGRRPGTAVRCAGARSGTEPRSRRRRSAA